MSSGRRLTYQNVALGIMGTALLVGMPILDKQKDVIERQDTVIEQYRTEVSLKEDTIRELNKNVADLNDQLQSLSEELDTAKQEIEDYKSGKLNVWGFSDSEIDLLNRLVEAEAGGESIEGRIAVANVVLNRIKSNKFPNNLYDVIYQKNQFEVVAVGTIDTKIPSEGTKEAVQRALMGEEVIPEGTVFFWAKYVNPNHAIWKHCEVVASIGVHNFATEWK